MRRPFLALTLALVAACGGDAPPLEIADECNPLGGYHCLTPWPSSAFEVEDATTSTGRRLAIPAAAMLENIDGLRADPGPWNRADGFSPAAPITVAIEGGFSLAGLVGHGEIERSLTATSPTVIVDLTTGARVAHWAELDAQATGPDGDQALYLRPAAALPTGHRFAVGLTRAVQTKAGAPMPRTRAFEALLAGDDLGHPRLAAMAARFGDVLAGLAAAGVAEADLALAWDFTVASGEFLHRDALTARDRALAAMATTPTTFTVTRDEPIDDGSVFARRIEGEIDAPLFLTEGGAYGRATVARDADGLPALQGTYRIPFDALVPTCAATAPAPVGILLYGHGLLGSSDQAVGGSTRDLAATACLVVIGTDMRGMSGDDIEAVILSLNDISKADRVMEVLVQGLVNHHALVEAARTTLASELFVVDDDGPGGAAPRSIVDPTKITYYGLSQGGIFGTTVVAYDPRITRGVVGVGGGNYSLMLERSTDWPQYRTVLSGAYPSTLDMTLAIGLFQMRWDLTEPSGVVDVMLAGTALGVPPKQLLIHMALADDEVPNLATEWQARSSGVPVLTPSSVLPYGLVQAASPIAAGGSALVVWDGGVTPPPVENVPAPDTGAHSLTREQPAAWRQMATFYATGAIVQECDGACTCHTGACQ